MSALESWNSSNSHELEPPEYSGAIKDANEKKDAILAELAGNLLSDIPFDELSEMFAEYCYLEPFLDYLRKNLRIDKPEQYAKI